MKKTLILILLISLFSCETNDAEKIKLNESATKLIVMEIRAERIYEINKNFAIVKNSSSLDAIKLFAVIDDTLQSIRDGLIAASGGVTRLGEYFNLPAKEYVKDYFYGKTNFGNNSHKHFFNSIDRFLQELPKVYPDSKLRERLNKKYEILMKYYGLHSKNMIFENLALNEAVELIESFRREIAIEQTEYLVKKSSANSTSTLPESRSKGK